MQIDFHKPRTQAVRERGKTTPMVIPVIVKRFLGLAIAILGLLLILMSLASFLTPRAQTPYALLFFQASSQNPLQSEVSIVWIDEFKNTVSLTQVPDALEFHSQSLGTYPLKSIYAAHESTKESSSDFLTDLSFYFRFPILAFLHADKSLEPSRLSLVRFTINACLSSGQTSLSFGQCAHTILYFSGFSTTVRSLDFPQSAVGEGRMESLKSLNRDEYRQWSQAHFSESFKTLKKYTVAVLNGTDSSGLATTASRILQDFGLSILYIGDTQTPVAAGEIVIDSKVSSQPALVSLLQTTLRLPSRVDENVTIQYRSNIVVFIGKQEKKFFTP